LSSLNSTGLASDIFAHDTGGVNVDLSYHFPPDLFNLLVETIPILGKSKSEVLQFFRNAGVPESMYPELAKQVRSEPKSINWFEITRQILKLLNENQSDNYLRMRREVVKRVVGWHDFTTCYDNKRLIAQGLVGQIQKLVEVVDSFTRMRMEKDAERKKNIDAADVERKKLEAKNKLLEEVKRDFFALFGMTDTKKRGKQFEGVLNRFFQWADILVAEAFEVKNHDGKTEEQIDGVIELDGTLYLVEVKWWAEPLGVPEMSQHIVRVMRRGGQVRGIIVSYLGYGEPAIACCNDLMAGSASITLCLIEEFVDLIEKGADVKGFLKKKVEASLLNRKPYTKISIEPPNPKQ
jgi:restriction system protein